MCCLFGLIDYEKRLSVRQRERMLRTLSISCEARGIDATGIAYNTGKRLKIYKRPLPAHLMRFRLPKDANIIMGHTRMTTQGNGSKNYNNHPFSGFAGVPFALAHNGVLHNDDTLRYDLRLPKTKIETDSYIAVQLIESKKYLSFSSLEYMAEKLRGSFTFTVLDVDNNLYFVRGDNPMCIRRFPRLGIYLYASTKEILEDALEKMGLGKEESEDIDIRCGNILRIDSRGKISWSSFDDSNLWHSFCFFPYKTAGYEEDEYIDDLKSVAMAFGYSPNMIDRLIERGYLPEEIEEFLYEDEGMIYG